MLSLLENILSSNTDLRFIRRDMRILAKARGEFATADWLERIYHLPNSKLPVIGGDGTAKEFGEWHRALELLHWKNQMNKKKLSGTFKDM